MTSARLLVVALLLCPLMSLAQENQQPATNTDPSSARPPDFSSWRTLNDAQKSELMRQALARLQGHGRFDLNTQHPWIKVSPDGNVTWGVDEDCYAIRSYVVARDEKDSDSVHQVGSSTCQRASRYQMKNADTPRDSDYK